MNTIVRLLSAHIHTDSPYQCRRPPHLIPSCLPLAVIPPTRNNDDSIGPERNSRQAQKHPRHTHTLKYVGPGALPQCVNADETDGLHNDPHKEVDKDGFAWAVRRKGDAGVEYVEDEGGGVSEAEGDAEGYRNAVLWPKVTKKGRKDDGCDDGHEDEKRDCFSV